MSKICLHIIEPSNTYYYTHPYPLLLTPIADPADHAIINILLFLAYMPTRCLVDLVLRYLYARTGCYNGLTLIGMSYESKKNAHLLRHLEASFVRLNELGRVSQFSHPKIIGNF